MTNATDERTTNDSVSIDADCSEVWRRAGEFFGLLQRKLGWGLLTMTSPVAAFVSFQWEVTVARTRFYVEQDLSFNRLMNDRSLEELATVWSENWRRMLHRRD